MTVSSDITVTDHYCGAGGSTQGALAAGMRVTMAMNHWDRAIETHNANYPKVTHVQTDLLNAAPRDYPGSTGLITSPECTEHTPAGGKARKNRKENRTLWEEDGPDLSMEAEVRSRSNMYTPLSWAEKHNYQFVVIENVVEARDWLPFQGWLQCWKLLGYRTQIVYFNSMFAHPTPQSRDRMYIVCTKVGNPKPNLDIRPIARCIPCGKEVKSIQSWKNAKSKHGKYGKQYVYRCPVCAEEVIPYYYAAANAINWELPITCIGDRSKPLAPKTMKRIKQGIEKHMHQPFTFSMNHPKPYYAALYEDAAYTQTTWDDTGFAVSPFLMDHTAEYRTRDIKGPGSTVCAGGNHLSLVTPPAASWLMTYYHNGQLASTDKAAPTVTTLLRHALITSDTSAGEIDINACGFRMADPEELKMLMAFSKGYMMRGTRRERVKLAGNAVTPPVMQLILEPVMASLR